MFIMRVESRPRIADWSGARVADSAMCSLCVALWGGVCCGLHLVVAFATHHFDIAPGNWPKPSIADEMPRNRADIHDT